MTALAFDPGGSGRAYAAGADNEVLSSADRGATWGVAGFIPTPFGRIADLAISPADPTLLYAAAAAGLYRSTDGGASWVALLGAGTGLKHVAISRSAPRTLYADGFTPPDRLLQRSSDGGATWTPVAAGPRAFERVQALAVDPGDAATVYLGTDFGFWLSPDGGSHWSSAGDPEVPGAVSQLVTDPLHPGRIFAHGSFGVYRSDDRGVSWMPVPGGPVGFANGLAPGASGTLYSVANDGTIWSSLHGRRPWRMLSALVPALDPLALSVGLGSFAFAVSVFAADPGSGAVVAGFPGCGLVQSADGTAFAPVAGVSAVVVSQLSAQWRARGGGRHELYFRAGNAFTGLGRQQSRGDIPAFALIRAAPHGER